MTDGPPGRSAPRGTPPDPDERVPPVPPVLRPRTIGPLGAPEPVPAAPWLETAVDPTWQPTPTQQGLALLDGVADATVDPDPGDADAADAPGTEPVDAAGDHAEGPATGTTEAVGGGRMLRNNLVVASGTAVSRLSGLVRTSLILVLLGQGLNDAYVNANNTPNMIYELILGGILTATLVPLFSDDLEKGERDGATSAIISFALVALLVVTALAALVAPLIILLLATGSADAARDDYVAAGVPLALLFAPQVFFYGLMALWSAVLNSRQRFLAAAWAPVLNNLIAIATLLTAGAMVSGNPTLADALDDRRILWVLGLGTTSGIAVMALSLYPALRRAGFRLRFRFDLQHPAVRRAVRLSGWTFGYVVANQVAVVVIQILAEPASGDPTRYQTAFQYFQLPHALLAVSIMVTFEPLLGRADSRGDRTAFNDHLLLGFRLIGLLIIPAAVGYVALPRGLDHLGFEPTGLLATALGLGSIIAAFAVGLPGFSTYLYALRGFYAMKNTKIPFVINVGENALNIVLALVLVRIWGVVGLALAFALAYNISAVVAVAVLCRHSPGFAWRALATTWLRLLTAALVMGVLVYGVVRALAPSSAILVLPTLGAGIVVGALVYFGAIMALRVPGISELFTRLPGLHRFAPRS